MIAGVLIVSVGVQWVYVDFIFWHTYICHKVMIKRRLRIRGVTSVVIVRHRLPVRQHIADGREVFFLPFNLVVYKFWPDHFIVKKFQLLRKRCVAAFVDAIVFVVYHASFCSSAVSTTTPGGVLIFRFVTINTVWRLKQ